MQVVLCIFDYNTQNTENENSNSTAGKKKLVWITSTEWGKKCY